MENKYTEEAKLVLISSKAIAMTMKHGNIGTEHLMLGILKSEDCTGKTVLSACGVDIARFGLLMQEKRSPIHPGAPLVNESYTPSAQKALAQAAKIAETENSESIGTEHILAGIMSVPDCYAMRLLKSMQIDLHRMQEELQAASDSTPMFAAARDHKEGGRLRGNVGSLEDFCRDLTKLAKDGKLDPVIGREREINRMIQILSRRTKNNPCLIGEPGVGKTAIVEGLAQAIADGKVPETVADKRLLALDISSMVAGSKYRGDFEERIKNVLDEIRKDGNILIFVDELHTIIGAGGAEGALDASNIMKPALSRGELQLVGATTIEEYRKHIEKDAALERRFQPITVNEPDEEETVEILRGLKHHYEKHHGVEIKDEALKAAAGLSARYISDRYLPDKAIDLIDEAASRVHLRGIKKPEAIREIEAALAELMKEKELAIETDSWEKADRLHEKQAKLQAEMASALAEWEKVKAENGLFVDEEDVASVVSEWTKIPVNRLEESETKRLLELEKLLHARVIGQEEGVKAIAKAIRRGRVGLKDPGRPIGSFLFLGPTGVGKTEISKALAEALWGTENALIRVDMSEYMEKHSVSRLVGSPPGYVGYEEGGQLSEKVRRNPYSVILFDEVEKAHPDVFNILLQVLDDGHITDSQGRLVDFKNTIIIMTSNVGAMRIVEPKHLGFAAFTQVDEEHERMKTNVMDEVHRLFKPEFLNRIDEMIVFHSLREEHIMQILDLQLKEINERTLKQSGFIVNLDEAAKKLLFEKGYDPKYGARPLRRTLQNELEDMLSMEILLGNLKGVEKVELTAKDGKLQFLPG